MSKSKSIDLPWWCGAHPDRNYNTDWCEVCDDEADMEDGCLKRHPHGVIHKREIRYDRPIRQYDDYHLWFSARHGEGTPKLWFADGSLDEADAHLVSEDDAINFTEDLNDFLKALRE